MMFASHVILDVINVVRPLQIALFAITDTISTKINALAHVQKELLLRFQGIVNHVKKHVLLVLKVGQIALRATKINTYSIQPA